VLGDFVATWGGCPGSSRRVTRPTVGLVTIRSELANQRGETVLELENTGMFLTREALS